MVYPTVAVRAKHRVIGRHVAIEFISELVEFERVLIVNLRLQFQQRLGGVFQGRFIGFYAVVRETVFVIAVDFISVCPSILVGRTFQIDCVRVRCASLEVDEAHQLSREAKTCLLKLVLTILVLGLAPPAFGNYFLTFYSIEFVQAFV